jgi:hypothetical protein
MKSKDKDLSFSSDLAPPKAKPKYQTFYLKHIFYTKYVFHFKLQSILRIYDFSSISVRVSLIPVSDSD